jgi:hypothetical protein
MNKKILIGSIIAVVILVLVSFTGVVGYQTTKSNSVKVSPLFNVRSKRAIGEKSKDIACEYVGKGNILPFLKRDDRVVMFQKVIDSIREMDDKAFVRFTSNIINYAQKDNRFTDLNNDEIINVLYLLRNSEKSTHIFDANLENMTFGYGLKGVLGCILLPFFIIVQFVGELALRLSRIIATILYGSNCAMSSIPQCETCHF